MSKSIDTLVSDIYALFDSNKSFHTAAIDEFGRRLARHVSNRITEQRVSKGSLRLSAMGTECLRKLWYNVNKPMSGDQPSPEARFKFLYGDILEELILFLAKEAGHEVSGEQTELEVAGVKGHRDAIIDGRLVDVKSASSFAFKKFENNGLTEDDPFGYLGQIGCYYEASEPELVDKGVASFIAVDKQLGKIVVDSYPMGDQNWKERVEYTKEVTSRPEPPDRCYEAVADGKSGNLKLGTVCSYCPYKFECWPEVRTFIYSKGPVYLTTIKKLPKVWEVDRNGVVIQAEGFMGTEGTEAASDFPD